MAASMGAKNIASKRPRYLCTADVTPPPNTTYDDALNNGAYGECLEDDDLRAYFLSLSKLLAHTERELTMEEQREREKALVILTINQVSGFQSCRTARKNRDNLSKKNKNKKKEEKED